MLAHVTFRHASKPSEEDERRSYWIILGGLTFEVTPGNLVLVGEAQGFHKPARMGDPMYLSNGYISMPWAVYNGVEPDWIHFGYYKDSPVQNEGSAFFAGPWGGYAGEFASVQVESRRQTLPGFIFPNISFSGAGGGFIDEEPYGQQGLDQLYPVEGSFQEGWQNWFSKGMTYDQGMIATRYVAFMFGAHNNPAYTQSMVGASYDGVTFRRLPTLTPAQITKLAKDAGVLPDADEAIPGAGPPLNETFSFSLIKPIGIVDDNRVLVTCVGSYAGKYTRRPKPIERAYYMSGRTGYYNTYERGLPLLDGPIDWIYPPTLQSGGGPVVFTESVSAYIFFTAVVGRFGFESFEHTGKAHSASSTVAIRGLNTNQPSCYIFKRVADGGYDAYWPDVARPSFGFNGEYYTTPNGWRFLAFIPSFGGTRDFRYCVVPCFANSATYSAIPPTKPVGAPPDWAPPPFDPPPDIWRGQRFRNIQTGQEYWCSGTISTDRAWHMLADGRGSHALYPDSDAYRRPGQNQYAGVGSFQVSPFGAKSVHTIKAGIGTKQSEIANPGGDPVMRYFEGPNGYALRKTQFGGWQIRQGASWFQSNIDFGEVRGTLSVVHTFDSPRPPG